ncbi:MAG: hypothetical protein QXF15_03660 [Candidatus Aenigmatarchaeota archaeon]
MKTKENNERKKIEKLADELFNIGIINDKKLIIEQYEKSKLAYDVFEFLVEQGIYILYEKFLEDLNKYILNIKKEMIK